MAQQQDEVIAKRLLIMERAVNDALKMAKAFFPQSSIYNVLAAAKREAKEVK